MRTLEQRVRKHQRSPMPLSVTVSTSSAIEAVEALATRLRWYESRNYKAPQKTLAAYQYLCRALGLDPMKVGRE